ncbi:MULTISPECIES: AAA family ATPase [unclassified Paenibacillus]|uniref:AAA family ATPase n=1 Tax=unclassified Paenibacillus TaxID=185978 RepID=UPI00048D7540|nr:MULTISPECIES: AAA family ATPase [unclassified Paenibacillus]SDF53175.1 Uncharacterized protein YhaN [Paenibacillus sp. cl6col]
MKILQIHLMGYGGFRDAVIPLAERGSNMGITLLYGPNEAGKSTITYFIRDMLYGLPKRRSSHTRYVPIEGAIYGGRMSVLDRSGAEWTIERWERDGSLHTSIRKVSATGVLIDISQSQLEDELLGGLNAGLFCRLFGITLDELQELQTLQDDEVGAYLYDTGLYGGRGITEAERWLQQSMDGLFRPRGRNQLINQTLHTMDKLERVQREAHRHAGKLSELEDQLTRIELELNQCVEQRIVQREELAKAERASDVADTWIRYIAAKQELDEQPTDLSIRLPELAAQWRELDRKLADTEAACRGIEEKRQAAADRKKGKEPFKQLLDLESETRRLAQLTDTVQHWREAAGEAEVECNAAEAELWRLSRQTDSSWTPEMLLASKTSLYLEQAQLAERRADACRLAIAQSEAGMEHAVREAQLAAKEYDDAKMQLERCETAGVNGSGFAPNEGSAADIARAEQSLADAMRVWNASSDGKEHVPTPERVHNESYSRRNRNAPRPQKFAHSRIIYGFGLGVVLLAAGLGWMAQQWLMALVIALVGLAATVVMAYVSSQSPPHSSDKADVMARSESAQDGLEHAIRVHAEALRQLLQPYLSSTARSIPDAGIDELRRTAQEVGAWHRERLHVQERCRSLYETVIVTERRCRLLTAELDAAHKKEEGRLRDWHAWLDQENLPERLTPAGVKEHCRRWEQAEEVEQQRHRAAVKHARLLGQLELFEQDCNSLLHTAQHLITTRSQQAMKANDAGLGEEGTEAVFHYGAAAHDDGVELLSGSMIGGLFRLLERIEREQAVEQEYQQLMLHSSSLDDEWKEKHIHASQMQETMNKLLLEAGVNTGFELLHCADAYNYKLELERQVRELEAVLYRGGERTAFRPMEELLIQYDGRELEQRCISIARQMEQLDTRIRELEGRKGRLEQERERLKQEVEGASHHQEIALQESKLDEQASRYAVLALAKTLLQRTRRLYEEEKQPAVLKRAAHYMEQMSAGRYTRVLIPFGEKTIALARPDGQVVWSHHFSRGTAEQVYLAIRFALAEALTNRASVPFVLDDILVNFDQERLGLAAKALIALSDSHHVMMTTCHPHVVDLIKRELPEEVRLIEMQRLHIALKHRRGSLQ